MHRVATILSPYMELQCDENMCTHFVHSVPTLMYCISRTALGIGSAGGCFGVLECSSMENSTLLCLLTGTDTKRVSHTACLLQASTIVFIPSVQNKLIVNNLNQFLRNLVTYEAKQGSVNCPSAY
jgi:hypothetical protein